MVFVAALVIGLILYSQDHLRSLNPKPKKNNSRNTIQPQPYDFSKLTGRILFQSDRDGDDEIYVMNPDGTEIIQLTHNRAFDGYPVWSLDGKRIVFESNRDGRFQIYIMDKDGNNTAKITNNRHNNRYPCWSPDGKWIAYQSQRENRLQIYAINMSKKKERVLTDSWYRSGLPNWSPDGKKIAFTANKMLGWGVYLMDRDGSNIQALDTKGGACRPHWSKDGKLIAYVSQKADKKGDIWIMNPDGSGKRRLTTDSEKYDYYPSWSRDGNWIVYANTLHKEKGNWEIRIVNAVSGESKQITDNPAQDRFPDWY